MAGHQFQHRECKAQACRFRFPAPADAEGVEVCPLCGAATHVVSLHVNYRVEHLPEPGRAPQLEALLDNIRSVYNVGSMFRTADGAGMQRLHLCGITTTPDHPSLAKTALGAESSVSWAYHRNGPDAAQALKESGHRLWAIEADPAARPLSEAMIELDGPPVVLVVGNEMAGVDPGILELCDRVLWIPMSGVKHSLNVAVAFGIAAYTLRQSSQTAQRFKQVTTP